jgi:patatin-like phospholipase/acyl hydrolase
MAFQILSLSGGGYRGLFTVEILKRLEDQAGRPIGQCFDLIAGTSIGGIIAIGLAMGKSAGEIEQVMLDRGEYIFPYGEKPRGLFERFFAKRRQWFEPKYDGVQLRKAIEQVIDAQTLIGHAKTRLIIPAVNMTKGSVQIFKTSHHSSLMVDKKRLAADVAMATSAAPFFFPMAKMGDNYLVDGGIVANAPDMCALHEARHFLGQSLDDVRMLSIGTTTAKFSLPISIGGKLGQRDWLENERLVSTIFSAQQQLVEYMVGHQLGERYVRMDETASAEQTSDLGLDLATPARRGTLLGMAEGVYQKFSSNPHVAQMLAHIPATPEFY